MLTMTLEKHYTIKQAAHLLEVSERTVKRWIEAGRLRVVHLPTGKYGKPATRIPASAFSDIGLSVIDETEPEK